LGLPPELLARSRGRLKALAIIVLVGTGADIVQMVAGALANRDQPIGVSNLMVFAGTLLTCACALALLGLTRSRRLDDARLLNLGLVFEVLVCLLISLSNPLSLFTDTQTLPVMTWVTPMIIFFPLIVPCPPRRTVLVAIVAAATRPLGLWVLDAVGSVPVQGGDYLQASFSPALAVVIAFLGSRAIYDLGLDVARARRLGSYELETRLGRGGMGEVWRARHRLLARPAAVKLIRPDVLGEAGSRERQVALRRFEREAQSTAALRSPHTVELFDFGVADDGTFYYVMELLEGLDTQTLVQRHGPLPAPRAVHVLQQVCHSLAEAHDAGLIHRDVKPANVFLCRYGRDVDFVKVLDFGLVKSREGAVEKEPAVTMQGAVHGTPAFMAPEQALGKAESDARTDVYALGCVAYWLLTGQLVFEGETAMEVLVHHARTAPTPPSQRTELAVPPALERLVLTCLEKDPDRRFERVDAIARELEALAHEDPWTPAQARRWWDTCQPTTSSGPDASR
jgi:serine/threonine-protein kinase